MFVIRPVNLLVLAWTVCTAFAALSDKRLCIDPQCTEQIAEAVTLLRYNSIEDGVLSFGPDEAVKIFSYGAGSRPELIGVEIGGRRGYVNKNMVLEKRLIKRPKEVVDTEAPPDVQASATQGPSEVVDGTRLPLDLVYFSTEAPPVHPPETSSAAPPDTTDKQPSVALGTEAPPGLETTLKPLLEDSNEDDEEEEEEEEEEELELLADASEVPPEDPSATSEFAEAALNATASLESQPQAEDLASVLQQPIDLTGAPAEVLNDTEPAEGQPEGADVVADPQKPPDEPTAEEALDEVLNATLLVENASSVVQVEEDILNVTDGSQVTAEASIAPPLFTTETSLEERALALEDGQEAERLAEESPPIVSQATVDLPAPNVTEPEDASTGIELPPTEADNATMEVPSQPEAQSFMEVEEPEGLPPPEKNIDDEPTGWFGGGFAIFGHTPDAPSQADGPEGFCDRPLTQGPPNQGSLDLLAAFSTDMFLYLSTTALAVLVLIFVWVLMDKWRRAGPLIARINHLEQQLLATSKENEALQGATPPLRHQENDELLGRLASEKRALEEQVLALEKELDNSTEMGIELNRIIGEMLVSSDGSDILKENVEQMQKRLLEQQDTIAGLHEALTLKEQELQTGEHKKLELDKKMLEFEQAMGQKLQAALARELQLQADVMEQKQRVGELERDLTAKAQQYEALKTTLQALRHDDPQALQALVQGSEARAKLDQLQADNRKYAEQLSREREAHRACPEQLQEMARQVQELRAQYEQADRDKVESCTKLAVLNAYFKEKEERMLKEISQYESLWTAKEGEATTTTERSRHLQEELQNYKAQNESLKQEIVNQEVALKSQISLLEKRAHETWVANRQAERKLEEARQEAALLRNRLTLTERSQLRMQSPLLQNGELPPDPAQSPPPLLPGMPPPFLPPPLGGRPFMLPPPADLGLPPPFIPGMFPGDHRPPPLGRMSSPPPAGGRYTPESTVYSEYHRYDRRSPSPPYDSEYGASPPPMRNYSPYDDRERREYRRSNGRRPKGAASSGSENDSLSRTSRKSHRKV